MIHGELCRVEQHPEQVAEGLGTVFTGSQQVFTRSLTFGRVGESAESGEVYRLNLVPRCEPGSGNRAKKLRILGIVDFVKSRAVHEDERLRNSGGVLRSRGPDRAKRLHERVSLKGERTRLKSTRGANRREDRETGIKLFGIDLAQIHLRG